MQRIAAGSQTQKSQKGLNPANGQWSMVNWTAGPQRRLCDAG
jgi:hypothetical protein